jgi:hypothetical protein
MEHSEQLCPQRTQNDHCFWLFGDSVGTEKASLAKYAKSAKKSIGHVG